MPGPGSLPWTGRFRRSAGGYGEAIIAATQQADVAESLIANSGIKIILRTDYPKDVDFASKLLQVDARWLAKLSLGTGIVRLPTRYYQPFLFTFPPQPRKNTVVTDDVVGEQYAVVVGNRPEPPAADAPVVVSEKERSLLRDIAEHPIAGVTARYERLGWNPKTGNSIKDGIIARGLAVFEEVTTATARVKILTLTSAGEALLKKEGVETPSWRRGGAAHEYWRETLRGILERHGYTVTDEYAVPGGYVDLHATKDDQEIFIEIETGKSDINANIEKCQALPGIVVIFFVDESLRASWSEPIERSANLLSASPAQPGAIEQLR